MKTNFQGTVTRNSNGSIEVASDSGALKQIEMGSRVEVSIEVVESATDIEKARAAKAKRTATAERERAEDPTPQSSRKGSGKE